jgi:hypothetical protein
MADCFPPEADDHHRCWLPREIFAHIGIVDTDAPTEADAVGVEELAAQLAGILGGASKVCPPPHVAAPHHDVQVSSPPAVLFFSCSEARRLWCFLGALAWP